MCDASLKLFSAKRLTHEEIMDMSTAILSLIITDVAKI